MPPAEQGANDPAALGAHPGKPRDPGAAVEPHDQRFELVVGMVRGGDQVGADRVGMRLQQPIPQRACARGQIGGAPGAVGQIGAQRGMRNSARGAQIGDPGGLICQFGAEPMIDRCRAASFAQRSVRKQQQRDAVRPARHRDEDSRVRIGQRGKIAREPRDRVGA